MRSIHPVFPYFFSVSVWTVSTHCQENLHRLSGTAPELYNKIHSDFVSFLTVPQSGVTLVSSSYIQYLVYYTCKSVDINPSSVVVDTTYILSIGTVPSTCSRFLFAL